MHTNVHYRLPNGDTGTLSYDRSRFANENFILIRARRDLAAAGHDAAVIYGTSYGYGEVA